MQKAYCQEYLGYKVIQEWPGHSNFSTTADIYAHLEDGMKRDAGSTLSDALSGDKKELIIPQRNNEHGLLKPHKKDVLDLLPVGIDPPQPKQVGSEREALWARW